MEDRTALLDIGGTSIKCGLADPSGVLLHSLETPTRAWEGGEALLRRLLCLLEDMRPFARIGVSTCGQVDRRTGDIRYATDNVPGYTGIRLRTVLEGHFGVPVAVLNDVNAAALGELRFGAARGSRNFLCVTFGTGIGGAVVLDGRLFTGTHGSAGEFGHLVTHKGGRPCTCGGRGCYEAYASTGALCRAASALWGEALDGRQVFARLGNRETREVVDRWIGEIVTGLSSLVYAFDPELIVLGGGVMRAPYVLEQLRLRLPTRLMESFQGVRLLPAELGNNAGRMGAFAAINRPGKAPP